VGRSRSTRGARRSSKAGGSNVNARGEEGTWRQQRVLGGGEWRSVGKGQGAVAGSRVEG
jgi:hypothetical protein